MNRESLFVALAIGLPCFGLAQQAPIPQASGQKVSFEEHAAPLSRLMPRLAEATHMPLKASKAVETEVLCIYVQDVTPAELIQKIADATGCEWKQAADGLYLSPKLSAREALTHRGEAARAKALQKAIDALDPAKKKATGGGENPAFGMFGGTDDPIFYQFLVGVGANALATISDSSRVVFSTRPTAKQIAIPTDMSQPLMEFVQRHNKAIADQQAAMKAQGNTDDEDTDMPTMFGMQPNRLIKSPPAKANFIVSHGGMFSMLSSDGLSIELVIYDAKGKELARETTEVAQSIFGMSEDEFTEAAQSLSSPNKKSTPQSTERPVELSTDTQRFVKGLMSGMGGMGNGPGSAMSPAVRKEIHDRMLTPNLVDPLSYPAELLVATAKARNLELVASLPDSFFSWLISLFMGNSTPTAILKRLDGDANLAVDKPAGWIIVAPTHFEKEPISRDDLGAICKAFDGKSDYSLDDLLALAHHGFGATAATWGMQLWVTLLSPGLMTISFMEDWDMLRLYDALSDAQKSELQKNGRIAVASFDDHARELADRLVYGSGGGVMQLMGSKLMIDQPKQTDPLLGDVGGDVENIMSEYGMDGVDPNDYRSEPTEVAPNGIPNQAFFTLQLSGESVIRPAVKTGDGLSAMSFMQQAMPVEQMASMMASYEQMKNAPADQGGGYAQSMFEALKNVQVGTQSHMHFRIYAGRDSFRSGQVVTSSFPGTETYTLHNLPPDLQKKFDKALKQAEAMMKDIPRAPIPAGGGATGP
jgi:hypothetical protein